MATLQRCAVLAFFLLWLVIGARSIIVVRNTARQVNDLFGPDSASTASPAPCSGTVLWTDGRPVP